MTYEEWDKMLGSEQTDWLQESLGVDRDDALALHDGLEHKEFQSVFDCVAAGNVAAVRVMVRLASQIESMENDEWNRNW